MMSKSLHLVPPLGQPREEAEHPATALLLRSGPGMVPGSCPLCALQRRRSVAVAELWRRGALGLPERARPGAGRGEADGLVHRVALLTGGPGRVERRGPGREALGWGGMQRCRLVCGLVPVVDPAAPPVQHLKPQIWTQHRITTKGYSLPPNPYVPLDSLLTDYASSNQHPLPPPPIGIRCPWSPSRAYLTQYMGWGWGWKCGGNGPK